MKQDGTYLVIEGPQNSPKCPFRTMWEFQYDPYIKHL